MSLIVVTGNSGTGKSTVLDYLISKGFHTADADLIVHQLYKENQSLKKTLVNRWGENILDANGQILRDKISEIVFDKQEELSWLTDILHKMVKSEILKQYSLVKPSLFFVAIPLYYEVKWDFADKVVDIWCSCEEQKNRLVLRGWSEEHICKRLSKQIPADKKLEMADFAIINNGTIALLKKQCDELINKIKQV